MNKNEALYIIKSAVETQDNISPVNFKRIISTLREFIGDEKILQAVDQRNWGETLTLIDNFLFTQTKFKPYYFLSDLENLDIDEEIVLTIDEIKEKLKISLLQFCTVKDLSGNVTTYCQHWENHRRICVAIERELMERLKMDRSILLSVYKKIIKARLGYYYRITLKEYFEPHDDNFDDDYEYKYGAKAYGYDSDDEFAFYEAFEGDIDAWRHYNQ